MANSVVKMERTLVGTYDGTANDVWEIEVSLEEDANSAAIIVPDNCEILTMTLSVATGGTGKVQTTTDKLDTVKNGTVTWVDWDYGTVAANTQAACVPPMAIRLVQVSESGTTKLTIRAQ